MNRGIGFSAVLIIFGLLLGFTGCTEDGSNNNKTTEPITSFFFTQNASSGTITPTGANDGTYVLTLNDVSSQTVYFSDRPKGIAGQIPTSDIVIAWGAASEGLGESSLIASLQILGSGNKANAIVFELSNPVYQPSERTLEYLAKIAPDGSVPPQLLVVQNTPASSLPEEFGQVTLFIDDSRQSTINHLTQRISISAINAIADEINKLVMELDQLKKDLSQATSETERSNLRECIAAADEKFRQKMIQIQKIAMLATDGFSSLDAFENVATPDGN